MLTATELVLQPPSTFNSQTKWFTGSRESRWRSSFVLTRPSISQLRVGWWLLPCRSYSSITQWLRAHEWHSSHKCACCGSGWFVYFGLYQTQILQSELFWNSSELNWISNSEHKSTGISWVRSIIGRSPYSGNLNRGIWARSWDLSA